MNFKRFDSRALFLDRIKSGISLFLGSGFSIYASDNSENRLPTGKQLLEELKVKFTSVQGFPDLSKACTVLSNTTKELFYDFLIKRFSVAHYNELYDAILKINITDIYTTNIDNLIHKIFSKSINSYLNNTSINGATFGSVNAIDFFPLHGSVLNPENGFIFSKTEIASAYTNKMDDWSDLRKTASNNSILFWGWSFEDSDAIQAMYSGETRTNENIDKWIILFEPEEYEIEFFTALNFNIIVSDTLDFLKFINDSISLEQIEETTQGRLTKYCPPIYDSTIPKFPLVSFFLGDTPKWSHIFSKEIPRTHYFNTVSELISKGESVFVIGIPASGKTTLMMQLLSNYITTKNKYFLSAPSKEEINLFFNELGCQECILYVDNCFRDSYVIIDILKKKNIQFIGFDRDFAFESQAYRLRKEGAIFEVCDITDLNAYDARKTIDCIPGEIKSYKPGIPGRDLTMASILHRNVRGQSFEKRFGKMVSEIYELNKIATQVFIMICYVHACDVPVSFDMLYSFLSEDIEDYTDIYTIVNDVGEIIKECSSDAFSFLNINFEEQDYYQGRSKYFSELIINSIPKSCSAFKDVMLKFVENVPIYKICRFDVFKRKAFDADYTSRAFSDISEGLNYYNKCANLDDSEFLYQQAALYFARKKNFTYAFEWIDKARNFQSFNIFSIDNTYAIIQFSSNIDIPDEDGSVFELLTASLDLLKNCYTHDRRKVSHAKTFGRLSIDYYRKYGYGKAKEYIALAHDWVGKERSNPDCGYRLKKEIYAIHGELSKVLNSNAG